VDIAAFRAGTYRRRTEGMLPEAEIVFLDEVFKANSAILNSLLTLLNERTYSTGATVLASPLVSVFAASNELPQDESLAAVFDRFLLRVRSDHLDAHHFHDLVRSGIALEGARWSDAAARGSVSRVSLAALRSVAAQLVPRLTMNEDVMSAYKSIVLAIRAEGVSLSDRRVVKLVKVMAANAWLQNREAIDVSDFFVLRHVWNTMEQSLVLAGVVDPVLDAHYRSHPDAWRPMSGAADLATLAAEVARLRADLASGGVVSDLQLFAHLRSLGELKGALQVMGTESSRVTLGEVDALLEHLFVRGHGLG